MAINPELRRMIQQAESERMAALFAAWSAEIEAASEAAVLRRHERSIQAQVDADNAAADDARRLLSLSNADLVEASAISAKLYGLLQQAMAGYDISVSVPEGVQVASGLIMAATGAEMSALFDGIEHAEDDFARAAQRSAAWAVQHGFVPHPNDLATLAGRFEPDGAWGGHFLELGGRLDAHDVPKTAPAMLKAILGGSRLDVVRQTVDAMADYSAGRLLLLIGRPSQVAGAGSIEKPTAGRSRQSPVLSRALDTVFA